MSEALFFRAIGDRTTLTTQVGQLGPKQRNNCETALAAVMHTERA